MLQLTVNRKNKRAAMKQAPFNRNNGFLNHRMRQNGIKHNKKYNPASDTEKGKIPEMRAKIPFKTG